MGNGISCSNLTGIKNCVDTNEEDFKFVDVKKKFIKRKLIESNQVDDRFYKKMGNKTKNPDINDSNNLRNTIKQEEYNNGRIKVFIYNDKNNRKTPN